MKFALYIFLLLVAFSLNAQQHPFKLIERPNKKQVDVVYNGTLLTSYCYYDSIMKPVLFPVNTLSGITVTRGFPLAPRPGERSDHPHHIGMWLNYEYVNGLDFWNNSTAIPFDKRSHYGSIIHESAKTSANKEEALLETKARWVDHFKKNILDEQTQYKFSVKDGDFIIDRITTLTASYEDVDFKDVKDGLLGFRVARELEHPSNEPETFLDNHGNPTTVPVINNDGVSGEYLSSEGLKGNDVWGTRGRWVSLRGTLRQTPVSITIIDHPENVGYPSYWHARGYGLFAVNPLGQEIFSKGKERLNFKLNKGKSVTFRYRVAIHEGKEHLAEEIETLVADFYKTGVKK